MPSVPSPRADPTEVPEEARHMSIVIHHNPDCGTSRNVVDIVRAAGYEPVVIEYLETGWTRPQLLGLFAAAGLTPRTALRTTKSPAAELGLLDPAVDDDALLDAMLEHPVLVNRPIVCSPKGRAPVPAERNRPRPARPHAARSALQGRRRDDPRRRRAARRLKRRFSPAGQAFERATPRSARRARTASGGTRHRTTISCRSILRISR